MYPETPYYRRLRYSDVPSPAMFADCTDIIEHIRKHGYYDAQSWADYIPDDFDNWHGIYPGSSEMAQPGFKGYRRFDTYEQNEAYYAEQRARRPAPMFNDPLKEWPAPGVMLTRWPSWYSETFTFNSGDGMQTYCWCKRYG